MAIHTERLERLARLLDEQVRDSSSCAFDLAQWGEKKTRRGGFLWLSQVECGTTACAVGLACLSEQFAADGLSYIVHDGELYPVYGDLDRWPAVRSFFGLTDKQALHLFLHLNYEISSGPLAAAAVAARIRGMVRRGRPRLWTFGTKDHAIKTLPWPLPKASEIPIESVAAIAATDNVVQLAGCA